MKQEGSLGSEAEDTVRKIGLQLTQSDGKLLEYFVI